MASSPFFSGNLVEQAPWQLRGENDGRIATLGTRATTLETNTANLYCRLNLGGDGTMLTATDTAIVFTGPSYDNGGFHSDSVNPTRLTIPRTGTYMVGGAVSWPSVAGTSHRAVFLAKNGSVATVRPVAHEVDITNANCILPVSTFDLYTAGDYLELYGWQNSGGNLAVKAQSGIYATNFWIRYMGPQ
ncbi:MAG: hypothetical protein LC792_04030 [Actinobacteria bacterium]|nr:hypothetical protein [Actinomycetota bacterium]